jgi:hypothetical protein
MKTLLLSLITTISLSSFAQIAVPNPSFEDWGIPNTWTYTPNDWMTQNNQLIMTSHIDSSSCDEELALRVTPFLGFETAAGVAWTEIDTDYIPANFNFCVKRHIDIPQDTVSVRLRFWNDGADVPFVVYENTWTTSSTDTTWNNVTMDLDQIEPIMHYVSIEVIAGYNGPLGGGSHLTWISVDNMGFDIVDNVGSDIQPDVDLLVSNHQISLIGSDAYQLTKPLIQLFDIRGKLVATTRENVLNFAHLRSGIYIAALSINGQTVATKRAFKQ